jgi:hypothetical protein
MLLMWQQIGSRRISAPKGNRNAVGNKGGGRKSTYKPEYVELARRLCLLRATDKEMVTSSASAKPPSICGRQTHIEFAEAIKEGKAAADSNVANRLYRRAMGSSHEAVKIVADPKWGAEYVVPTRSATRPTRRTASSGSRTGDLTCGATSRTPSIPALAMARSRSRLS